MNQKTMNILLILTVILLLGVLAFKVSSDKPLETASTGCGGCCSTSNLQKKGE